MLAYMHLNQNNLLKASSYTQKKAQQWQKHPWILGQYLSFHFEDYGQVNKNTQPSITLADKFTDKIAIPSLDSYITLYLQHGPNNKWHNKKRDYKLEVPNNTITIAMF